MSAAPVIIRCGNCGQQLRIPAERLGEPGKCPKCGTRFGPVAPGVKVQPRRGRLVRRLSLAYLVVVAVLTGCLYGLGDAWWPATLLLFGPRWLLLLPWPVLVALIAWRDRRWRAAAVVALTGLLLAFGWMGFRVNWPPGDGGPDGSVRVRILTCNADAGALRADDFVHHVWAEQPDLVALEDAKVHRLRPHFPDPEWHVAESPGSIALLSRWPIRSEEKLTPRGAGNWGAAALYTVEVGGAPVRVLVLHLPTVRDGLEAVLARRSDAPALLEDGIARRDAVAGDARALVNSPGPPAIVAGDFNLPPESRIYRRHWGDWTNAFGAAGTGLGHTFFTRRSSVRIDHILADDHWDVVACRVGPDVGSAHRPVTADLRLRSR